jgi:glutathione synthase/RimK-type ligase-like ATP-grasp enzyme
MRVAVLTCRTLPSFVTWEIPDVDELFADDRALLAEFGARGISAEAVVWSDPGVDWDSFDVALIRSTWDYIDQHDRFLSVLARIEGSTCRLFNPPDAVRWNLDKKYLFDLQRWQVPTVPTWRASVGETVLGDLIATQNWSGAVVKSTVGVGASDVHRLSTDAVTRTLAQLAERNALGRYLVQPLVASAITEGEWSFIFIGGTFSHAVLKKPAPGDYRAHGIYGGSVRPASPSPDDLAQAHAILARLPFALLYARLDLVRINGRLAVMEIELVEPLLYFGFAPEAAGRLAEAVQAAQAG